MKNQAQLILSFLIMLLSPNLFAQSYSIEIHSSVRMAEDQAPLRVCEGSVNPILACGSTSESNAVVWSDETRNDWAGTIMMGTGQAFNVTPGSILVGEVKFIYTAKAGTKAVKLKSSYGGKELSVEGAVMEFENPQGERLLVVSPGVALVFTMPFSFSDVSQKSDLVVEVSPAE
jgi:hypothetical protein